MAAYFRFLLGHSANALSIGVQMVLVAWLAAGILYLPPQKVGWVQAAVLAPNILIILFAGALTDRFHPARILTLANALLCVVHMSAFFLLSSGGFSLITLLIYAASLGCGNSFIQAAREKLVAQLSEQHFQRNIARAGIAQQAAQGLGIAIASLTDIIGASALMLAQAVLCFVAMLAYGRALSQVNAPLRNEALGRAVSLGLRQVWRQVAVRHIVMIVGFNGFMHMGMFIVLLPLIARDRMGFSSLEFGLLQLTFTVGGVLSHWVLMRKASVRYPGQSVLFCILYAGLIGFAMSMPLTVVGLFGLVFMWGCVAGSSANLSRVVVQTLTPGEYRGRAMAAYQLALFGMAPFGALLAGYMVEHAGMTAAFRLIAWSSAALFAASLFTKRLWSVEPHTVELSEDRTERQ